MSVSSTNQCLLPGGDHVSLSPLKMQAHSENPGGHRRMTTDWVMVILPRPTILFGVGVGLLVGAAWNVKPGALV